MNERHAIVRLDGERAGTLTKRGRATTFQYDRAWIERNDALTISLTIPLRSEPYESEGLHPFFENLLPEGWLLDIATSKLKLSKDAFGLLVATCADCVGAVEILPDDNGAPTGITAEEAP